MTVVSKTCGTCSSYAEVCCDYGVCERDLRLVIMGNMMLMLP